MMVNKTFHPTADKRRLESLSRREQRIMGCERSHSRTKVQR